MTSSMSLSSGQHDDGEMGSFYLGCRCWAVALARSPACIDSFVLSIGFLRSEMALMYADKKSSTQLRGNQRGSLRHAFDPCKEMEVRSTRGHQEVNGGRFSPKQLVLFAYFIS